jgi:hypothetical protein
MKKNIILLTLLAGAITAQADDYPYLTFETNNGEIVSVEISSDVALVFSSTTLKVGDKKTFMLKDLKRMYFSNYDQTTGISTINVDDNQIFGYYDLQGRPVEQPKRGVYIIKTSKGTKKVFVK